MLILSLQGLLPNQNLERIHVCIVVWVSHLTLLLVLTSKKKAWDQTRQAFVTRLFPFCDRTSKFVHRPQNIRSPNTSQIQRFQNNLWANCGQFSYWLNFFFFKLMVIHTWRCAFEELLSRFVYMFAISFHTFRCVPFHVIGPRRHCFCIRFPWSSGRSFFFGSSRNPGFEHISVVCHNIITDLTLSLSATQIYMVKKWCWFSQINVFHEFSKLVLRHLCFGRSVQYLDILTLEFFYNVEASSIVTWV